MPQVLLIVCFDPCPVKSATFRLQPSSCHAVYTTVLYMALFCNNSGPVP